MKFIRYLLLAILLFPGSSFALQDLEVSNLHVEFTGQNTRGRHWFTYSITVTNDSNIPRKIRRAYKAVDKNGAKLISVYLEGFIAANDYKTLSGKDFMTTEEKNLLHKWEEDELPDNADPLLQMMEEQWREDG